MTEEVWDADVERINIARDLSAIEDAYLRLRIEAYHHADNPDIPGGDPMVMLGPRADVEAWGYVQLSAMTGRLNDSVTPTQGPFGVKHRNVELDAIVALDVEPPLSFLAGWVDIIRAERQQGRSNQRATIGSEVDYLRNAIDWILATNDEGAPWWLPAEDFARQLGQVRWALDKAIGRTPQVDKGEPCIAHGRRYVKQWAGTDTNPRPASEDRWKCGLGCETDEDGYQYAAQTIRRARATKLTAVEMDIQYGISPSTLRTWADRGCVPKVGKTASGAVLYDVATAKSVHDGDHKHGDCGADTQEARTLRALLGA